MSSCINTWTGGFRGMMSKLWPSPPLRSDTFASLQVWQCIKWFLSGSAISHTTRLCFSSGSFDVFTFLLSLKELISYRWCLLVVTGLDSNNIETVSHTLQAALSVSLNGGKFPQQLNAMGDWQICCYEIWHWSLDLLISMKKAQY